MPLYKVKIEQGAFIDDTLYREGEVVELPKGVDPMWGVRCKEDGTELETMSEKIARSTGINEHLAKSIESDKPSADPALVKENAQLKAALEAQQKQIDALVEAQKTADTTENKEEDKTSDQDKDAGKDGKPALDEAAAQQVDEAVKMLEDANDEHWTTRGEPQLAMIKDITGLDVSREDVDGVNDRRREKPAK